MKLNEPLLNGNIARFDFSPDGLRVVYSADQDTNNVREIYASNLLGSGNVKLNGALPADTETFGFVISPNSRRVVYPTFQNTTGVQELHAVSIDGSNRVKLNAPLPTNGEAFGYRFSLGGSNAKLNGPLPTGGGVFRGFEFTPDGEHVVYTAEQDTNGVAELYMNDLGGTGSVKLSGPLTAGPGVESDFLVQ